MYTKTRFLVLTIFTIFIFVAAQCATTQPDPAAQQTESQQEDHHEDEGEEHEEEEHEGEEHEHEAHEHEAEMPELTAVSLADGEKLKVLATTSIVGDIVNNVGGEAIELTVLLPLGTDPHGFSPAPADLAAVADAHVIFANGMGLEEFLDEMIENAGGEAAIVHVSHGIEPRQFEAGQGHEHEGEEHEGEEHEGEEHEGEHHHHEGADPHTWMTPANATIFVHNIEHALSELDPAQAETYSTNAETYEAELAELDTWIKTQIESIPADNRKLVSDHITFGYYADRYGLEMIGAVMPSVSTSAEPSAQDLAELQDAISEYGVKAVFVGTSVNPALAQRMAEDAGIELVPLYTGSLSEPDGDAATYLDYIRYNTRAIVEALK